eukprot:TRINITY_DN4269_c1_g1_i1.p1 TRINITY_DN4269_c1_g1~~TRINITY_DN4269_c1_g1_i1.p1  ORF type:complete len:252 (-),score=74.80 TRINITY_DN4269_c1_g1_i1:90-845(-)
MVFCGNCGNKNPDNAKFCESCGEALEFEDVGEVIEEVIDDEIEEVIEVVEELHVEEPLEVEPVRYEPVKQHVEPPKPKPQSNNTGAVLHSVKRTGAKTRASGVAKWENQNEVKNLIAQVLNKESFSGWILIGYQDDNCTLEIQAHGEGGVNEFVPLLNEDQWQYALVRTQDQSKNIKMGGETKITTRDVFITWQGPSVSILQRGKFNEHRNVVKNVLQPSHAELYAFGKKNFTEEEVANKSGPLSGSHEIY